MASFDKLHAERWLLPEGIEEWLPPNARQLEDLRQKLLELYRCHGYEFIMPPMVEYVESILSGIGNELELETFKVVDKRSGRLLGLRADITPQSARVDAHRLLERHARVSVNRLCYLGPVLRAVAADGRCVHQTGAELYGHKGITSDAEILLLMWEVIKQSNICDAMLDIGHVGIFDYLVADAGLDIAAVKKVMQRRAVDDLQVVAKANSKHLGHMQLLLELHGGVEVLDEASKKFRGDKQLLSYVTELRRLVDLCVQNDIDADKLRIDLAELRGSQYHNGVVFAAYRTGDAKAIASGGRYDHIGSAFGSSRKATGFSAYLESLFLAASQKQQDKSKPKAAGAILAPWPGDNSMCRKIRQLREQGECVINRLGAAGVRDLWQQCDRELVKSGNSWRVVKRNTKK